MSPRSFLAGSVFLALGAMLSACGGSSAVGFGPFVRGSTADEVEIGFSGDVANAMPLARQHCAQFERVPRLVGPTLDGALFDCVRPGAGS